MDVEGRKTGSSVLKGLGHVVALVILFYLADQIAEALSLEGAITTPIIYAAVAFLYYSGLSFLVKQK